MHNHNSMKPKQIDWRKQLFTINGLSEFTSLDRRKIRRVLEGIPPADPLLRRWRLDQLHEQLTDAENVRVLRHRLMVVQHEGQ